MAAGLLVVPGAQPSRSRNGGAVTAELRFYLNETTTPATVYTDEALTTPHEFPILSDAAGRFDLIYADAANTFTANWSTADGQTKTFDGVMPSVPVASEYIEALDLPVLTGGNDFTGQQRSDVGFRATGALGGLGFDDRANDRQYQLYSSNDTVAIYDGATNLLEYTRAGGLTLRSTGPSLAAYDTDVSGKGGAFRLRPNYSAQGSFYNLLEGGGVKLDISDSNAGGFTAVRTALELFTNTAGRTDDTGAFFPNGGQPIGEDGHLILRTNVVELLSDNTLHTADIPSVVSHTITGGAFTAISLQVGKTGYVANANGTTNKLYRVAAQGVGRSNLAHTNLIGWMHTDGAGATTGVVTIEQGGTDYVQDQVYIVGSPPPGATALDVGPQFNLSRDAPVANGTYLGGVVWQGRFAGSSSIDSNYAQLLVKVIDGAFATAEAGLVVATVDTSAGAGSSPRWEIGKAITAQGLNRPATGKVNATGFEINNVDLFGGARTWSAAQTFTAGVTLEDTDAGANIAPTLTLYRNSASPAAEDSLGGITFSGKDSGASVQPYAQITASIIDPVAGTEDGRLNLRTCVAGAFDNRFFIGAGLFANAVGVTDPGAGNMGASAYYVAASKVVGARKTGWAVPTGTKTRTGYTVFAGQTISASPTQAQVQAIDDHVKILSERLAALIADLEATSGHGLIGA